MTAVHKTTLFSKPKKDEIVHQKYNLKIIQSYSTFEQDKYQIENI